MVGIALLCKVVQANLRVGEGHSLDEMEDMVVSDRALQHVTVQSAEDPGEVHPLQHSNSYSLVYADFSGQVTLCDTQDPLVTFFSFLANCNNTGTCPNQTPTGPPVFHVQQCLFTLLWFFLSESLA